MAKSGKQAIVASKARNKAKVARAPQRAIDHPVARATKLRDEFLRLHGGDSQEAIRSIIPKEFEQAFCFVLAKTQLAGGVDKTIDWSHRRETIMEIVGEIGWCNLAHMTASCLRLWAEVPGIVPVPELAKDLCHQLAAHIQDKSHQFRLIDDMAKRPSKEPG
jgi:hypothetical protein